MIEHKPECSYPDRFTILTQLDDEGVLRISCVTCGSTKLGVDKKKWLTALLLR